MNVEACSDHRVGIGPDVRGRHRTRRRCAGGKRRRSTTDPLPVPDRCRPDVRHRELGHRPIQTKGTVNFGRVGQESCTAHTVSASKTSITVNGIAEYQWKAKLSNLVPNAQYCYRVFLGTTDLLGAGHDVASVLVADPSRRRDPVLVRGLRRLGRHRRERRQPPASRVDVLDRQQRRSLRAGHGRHRLCQRHPDQLRRPAADRPPRELDLRAQLLGAVQATRCRCSTRSGTTA